MTLGLTLRDGMELSGMSWPELWTRYINLGGSASIAVLQGHVADPVGLTGYEHDVIAQAINEHFTERGEDHPVAYTGAAHPN
jgi:hypothetical protein